LESRITASQLNQDRRRELDEEPLEESILFLSHAIQINSKCFFSLLSLVELPPTYSFTGDKQFPFTAVPPSFLFLPVQANAT